eukprot:255254_1
MDPAFQSNLKGLVNEKRPYNAQPLWLEVQTVQPEDTHTCTLSHLIQSNHVNRDISIDIMCLFAYLPRDFAYFDISQFTFYRLLDVNFNQLNLRIKYNLNEYINNISNPNEWKRLLDGFHFIIDAEESICPTNNWPSGMSQFNAEHIAFLLKHEINQKTYQSLSKYQNRIAEYVVENAFDGDKLFRTGTEQFAVQLTKLINTSNKKLKKTCAKLSQHMRERLSTLTVEFMIGTIYREVLFKYMDKQFFTERQRNSIARFLKSDIPARLVSVYLRQHIRHRDRNNEAIKYTILVNGEWKTMNPDYYATTIQMCCDYFGGIYEAVQTNNRRVKDTLCDVLLHCVKLNKQQMRENIIQQARTNDCFPAFQKAVQHWTADDLNSALLCTKQEVSHYGTNGSNSVATLLCNILETRSPEQDIQIQSLRKALRKRCMALINQTLQRAVEMNINSFVQQKIAHSFDLYVEKAGVKLNMPSVKQMKAVWHHGMNEHHNILSGDVISRDHVTALVSYTNNSELCTEFRETYRSIKPGEDIISRKMRHSHFAHFGRLLYESYVFYASARSKVKILYHGMSAQMIFSSLQCAFDQPTSTTTEESVATSFTHGTGMVLSFESCESCKYIKTLDMSLFSCYDTEQEHLIFEARLRIKDIFIPTNRQWIGKRWIKTLTLYDLLVHGNTIYEKHLLTPKNQLRLSSILQHVIDDTIQEMSPSAYLDSLMKALMKKNQKLWLNIEQIKELQTGLKDMFMHQIASTQTHDFGMYLKYLQRTCDAVIYPIFRTRWQMTSQTFDLISRVSGDDDNKLIVVVEGEPVKCILSEHKQIVFRPQFTMVQCTGIVNVKMILQDVYHSRPIKVHFNLQCLELNYHASLHPRWMDVEERNSFDIALPPIDSNLEHLDAIALNMSIMIHNLDAFGIKYRDLDELNTKIMTQNMEHSNITYKCADALSLFYGVCNSVVSVLDSISDIFFIVFMWHYTANREYHDNDELRHDSKTTTLLAVLCIGNLLSVSIIIALYTSYRIASNQFCLFWVFLISSPVLPAFEYIWHRLEKRNDIRNRIVVSLQYDGLLVWTKRELFRNRIFLIECISESCFQIIAQFVAVFALQSLISKDAYLYSSISISLIVIVSKLILCSYNMDRKRMVFNILCFCLDILIFFLMAIFMGSVVLGNTVTFSGSYLVLEWLLFISFGCYHIAQSLSVSALAMPILILLCYPMTICSFSTFSMYPLFSYLVHDPIEIGKRQAFHQKLYQYCCDSTNQNEFNAKLIVANYVCVQTYSHQLSEDDDPQYYQFAKWLCKQNESILPHIPLQTFRKTANNTIYHKAMRAVRAVDQLKRFRPSVMLFAKISQLLIRTVLIIPCILFDTFYLKLFAQDDKFMHNYGNVVSSLGAIVLFLFLICVLFIICEHSRSNSSSKWNVFCTNMICSTHKKFVLLTSSDEFIQKCKNIMDSVIMDSEEKAQTYNIKDEIRAIYLSHSVVDSPHHPTIERVSMVQFFEECFGHGSILNLHLWQSVLPILIATTVIVLSYSVGDCYMDRSRFALIYIRTTMIMSMSCVFGFRYLEFKWGPRLHGIHQIIQAVIFALHIPGILFWTFALYFQNNVQCESQTAFSFSTLLLILLFIGSDVVIALSLVVLPYLIYHLVKRFWQLCWCTSFLIFLLYTIFR